jgi:hypothetical protein
MKFVAKPIITTANRFLDWEESSEKIKSFVGTHFEKNTESSDFVQAVQTVGVDAYIWDRVHDNWLPVKNGQWIVRGEEGEFDVVSHKFFITLYDLYQFDNDDEKKELQEWQVDYTAKYNALGTHIENYEVVDD